MAISKVIYKSSPNAQGVTWIDATPATATAADIMSPKTAMLADGVMTQGTGSGGGTGAVIDMVEQLPGGGEHHIITGVDISSDTVTAAHLETGYTAHDAEGNPIVGVLSPENVTVESKSISLNGTYTAPSGKAYSPVIVSVPNSYAAGDEGKVVSNGALVAQTAHTEVTQNGTIDTTLNNSVTVNVSGGVERTTGTLTFAARTAWAGYTLDVGIDAAQFAIYATTNPLQSNGRTFQGFFVDLATSYAKGGLWVSSNSAGSASSGSFIANSSNVSKSGTVLTFKGGSSDYFQADITYQWYAWGAAT